MMRGIPKPYRALMLMSYAIQSITVLSGALLMSSAIEAASAQRFTGSALMVAVAFWNAKLFVDTARDRRALLERMRRLQELERLSR